MTTNTTTKNAARDAGQFIIRYARKNNEGYFNGACGGDLLQNAKIFSSRSEAEQYAKENLDDSASVNDLENEKAIIEAEAGFHRQP